MREWRCDKPNSRQSNRDRRDDCRPPRDHCADRGPWACRFVPPTATSPGATVHKLPGQVSICCSRSPAAPTPSTNAKARVSRHCDLAAEQLNRDHDRQQDFVIVRDRRPGGLDHRSRSILIRRVSIALNCESCGPLLDAPIRRRRHRAVTRYVRRGRYQACDLGATSSDGGYGPTRP